MLYPASCLDVDRCLLSREEPVHGGGHRLHVDLPDRGGQQVHDPLVRHGHHTLTVDLDDAVADSNSAPLGNTAAQQAADLKQEGYSMYVYIKPRREKS